VYRDVDFEDREDRPPPPRRYGLRLAIFATSLVGLILVAAGGLFAFATYEPERFQRTLDQARTIFGSNPGADNGESSVAKPQLAEQGSQAAPAANASPEAPRPNAVRLPIPNVDGLVIGMNSDALLRGCDLTLPHATIARVSSELLAHGRVRRGYLGVATQPLRLPAALRESLEQRSGALVVDVADGGPAGAAGLRFGDVVIAIDAVPVRGSRELSALLADKAGVQVSVRYVRGGAVEAVELTLAERG